MTCNTADSGSPTACDGTDSITLSFRKPFQKGNLGGFSLYRATEASLGPLPADSPVVDAATCVVNTFGVAAAAGSLVSQAEIPVSTPTNRTANIYLVCHRRVVPNGPAPCDFGRPTVTGTGMNGPTAPRFLTPTCP